MTALALDKDLHVASDSVRPGDGARRGPTLDDVVVGVWEGLLAHHPATCPICGGEMTPRYGSGPRPVGGRCAACASTLH
jgi:hypothetical protein